MDQPSRTLRDRMLQARDTAREQDPATAREMLAAAVWGEIFPAAVEECPRNPGGGHMHKPAALKSGHWCAYCGAPKPAAVQEA